MQKQFFLNKKPTAANRRLFDRHFKRYFMGLMNAMRTQMI